MNSSRLCIIGNLLGRNPGHATTQGQLLGELLLKEGYPVVMASSKVNRLYRLVEIVSTVIRNRNGIDVLILEVYSGMNFFVTDVVGRITRLFGIPTIFVLHGGNLPQFTGRLRRWTTRSLIRADKLISPSKYLARELKNLGLPIDIIPNLIEVSDYPFELRRKAKPTLLWMRAFHEIYNPEMALHVLRLVREEYEEACLVMAGVDKGLEPKIKKLADDLGLKEAIRFPGFLDQESKIREFRNADIFLNTNHIDNMPVAVLEACAMGLPVVSTCVGGIPDLLENGKTGLLVPDGDVNGMVNAVDSLLKNPDFTERISRNGRTLAERSSWEVVRLKWIDLFDQIQRKKRPSIYDLPVRGVSNT